MNILLVIIAFSVIATAIWQYLRILNNNEEKLVEVIKKIRISEEINSPTFPLIVKSPAMPGGSGRALTTFETRTIISYQQAWKIMVVTPAGVQTVVELKPNEIHIKLPEDTNDLSLGLDISDPIGFIDASVVFMSEPVTLFPTKKTALEMQLLVTEFKSKGAVVN